MANVFDVASYILEKTGEISTMKLQKLVYYSQSWNLAWDNKPMFPEDIQAWINGPVVEELYQVHKGKLSVDKGGLGKGDSRNLDGSEIATIDAVLDAYGHLDGYSLGSLTHEEDPWISARNGLPPNARSQEVIKLDAMRDYYAAQFAQQS